MNLARVFLLVAAGALGGCVSYVTVEPAAKGAKGIPFSLAEPYLLVEPQPDGSATYTWFYLPNESRRYVVRPVAVLAKQTFEIELSHGMLSKATSKPDASDVATKFLEGGGSVFEQREKTQTAAANAKREAAQTAATKRAEALAAAQKEVTAATLELKQAEAKVNAYTELKITGDKLAEAKVAVATAQARLDVANSVLTSLAPDPATASMNMPGANASTQAPVVHKVAGPMLFRVIQHEGGRAELRAVAIQGSYPTSTALKAPKAAASGTAGFKLSPSDKAANHATEVIVKTTATVEAVSKEQSTLTDIKGEVLDGRIAEITPTKEKGEFKVTFKKPLGVGTYNLSLATRASADADFTVGEALEFTVGAP